MCLGIRRILQLRLRAWKVLPQEIRLFPGISLWKKEELNPGAELLTVKGTLHSSDNSSVALDGPTGPETVKTGKITPWLVLSAPQLCTHLTLFQH